MIPGKPNIVLHSLGIGIINIEHQYLDALERWLGFEAPIIDTDTYTPLDMVLCSGRIFVEYEDTPHHSCSTFFVV